MKKLSVSLFLVLLTSTHTLAALPASYESWAGCAKQAYLWEEKIVPSTFDVLPPLKGSGWLDIIASLKAMVSLKLTFDHVSDELPKGREKFIHAHGSVAAVRFEAVPDSPMTGILSEGACGLARLSLAGPPDAIGYTPGMALKFFVNGSPSLNIQAMHSLNGQGENQNFFEHVFATTIPEPKGTALRILRAIFSTAKSNPVSLSVAHLATTDRRGNRVERPVVPKALLFRPTKAVQIDPGTNRDLREELGKIPMGSVLYTVWAVMNEKDAPVLVGRLVTQSRFVASAYGDYRLFFQHHR